MSGLSSKPRRTTKLSEATVYRQPGSRSDGDVDYGWICATTGNDCGGGGGGGSECGAGASLVGTNGDGNVYYLGDEDGAFHWIPDVDTFDFLGFSWDNIVWCDSLPDPPISSVLNSVHLRGTLFLKVPGDDDNYDNEICTVIGHQWINSVYYEIQHCITRDGIEFTKIVQQF